MKRLEDLGQAERCCRGGTALCIGVFDGVHRGHQQLMQHCRKQAKEAGWQSLVLTFTSHPLAVLAPPYAPKLLTGAQEKAELIRQQGMDLCLMLDFTESFAAIEPDRFIREVLVGTCRARVIACGKDFRFGAKGAGDVHLLREQAGAEGYKVHILPSLYEEGIPVKSTRIRQCLIDGHIREAERLMGHPYRLHARVVAGDRRGRRLGYPTANLEVPAELLIPCDGVYAVRTTVEGETFGGMMNIGMRPTFAAEERTLEVHLLDFAGDLYDRDMKVEWVEFVRSERRFASGQALAEQIASDEAATRRILADRGCGAGGS